MDKLWLRLGSGGGKNGGSSGSMPEEYYDRHFPRLRTEGFKRTSEPDYYNCIAFAAGDLRRKWWPGEYAPGWSPDYWLEGIAKEESLEAFIQAFATVGYKPCADGYLETGSEKIAIFAAGNEVRHTAKQNQDGSWTSKLGPDEDIEHTLTGLEGPFYGKVIAFLKRQRGAGD
jgi:hypothetical protein